MLSDKEILNLVVSSMLDFILATLFLKYVIVYITTGQTRIKLSSTAMH